MKVENTKKTLEWVCSNVVNDEIFEFHQLPAIIPDQEIVPIEDAEIVPEDELMIWVDIKCASHHVIKEIRHRWPSFVIQAKVVGLAIVKFLWNVTKALFKVIFVYVIWGVIHGIWRGIVWLSTMSNDTNNDIVQFDDWQHDNKPVTARHDKVVNIQVNNYGNNNQINIQA